MSSARKRTMLGRLAGGAGRSCDEALELARTSAMVKRRLIGICRGMADCRRFKDVSCHLMIVERFGLWVVVRAAVRRQNAAKTDCKVCCGRYWFALQRRWQGGRQIGRIFSAAG